MNFAWIIIIAIALWVVLVYNGLVRLRNRVREAWSDIEVQLKRRYDLIPNLVNTVKGYMKHEREVFEKVTEARARALGAQTRKEKGAAENTLSETLKTLFAVSENYPQLKANENFLDLQGQLRDTEDKIAIARQVYNDTVLTYNNSIQVFPAVMIAGTFGFTRREFYEIDDAADREVPTVSFRPDAPAAADAPEAPAAPPAGDAPAPPSI